MKIEISRLEVIKSIIIAIMVGCAMLILMSFISVIQQDIRINKEKKIKFLSDLDDTLINKELLINRIKSHKIWESNNLTYELLTIIEEDIAKHPFVKNVDVYTDTKGELNIRLALYNPIARVVRDKAPDAYITMGGTLMPRVRATPLRMLIITGEFANRIINEENGSNLLTKEFIEMLKVINRDPFYAANISQLDVDAKGEIKIIPQVGKQIFYFGNVNRYEEKLNKFKIVYTKVFPKKGWGYYKDVNLKYKNQIIAN